MLHVFGTDYDLPSFAIEESKFLKSLFSGRYGERHTAQLHLDESLQPAFDIVYGYLFAGQLKEIPVELFQDVLLLASYLNIPALFPLLADELQSLPWEIVDTCTECANIPEIREGLFDYYTSNLTFFSDLPLWVQKKFPERETERPAEGEKLYLFLSSLPVTQRSTLPPQNTSLYS